MASLNILESWKSHEFDFSSRSVSEVNPLTEQSLEIQNISRTSVRQPTANFECGQRFESPLNTQSNRIEPIV